MVNNALVLCKNFTKNGDPIDRTNRFSSADPFIVGLAILDSLNAKSIITLEMIWQFKLQPILHQRQRFLVDSSSNRHRFESYIKVAFVEYKKLFGSWTLSLLIDGKEKCKEEFIVIKPNNIYGKDYRNSYQKTNSFINIAY